MKQALAWSWAALLCAVLLAQTWLRASRPGGIDLTSYLLSAQALLRGDSPYVLATPFPYLYPATLAFVLIPLALAPPLGAVVVWFVLSVAAAAWSTRTVLLAVRPDLAQRPGDVAAFLAVFFTFFFTIAQSNLRNGQVNFVVLFLCVLSFTGARASKEAAPAATPSLGPREQSFNGAGAPPPARTDADASPRRRLAPAQRGRGRLLCLFAWSLAVALKLMPLALTPFFALRRSWTWLAGSLLLIGVWCLLPVVVLGARVVDVYEQYWQVFLASSFAPRVQPIDFSLAGTIAFVTGAPLTSALRLSAAAVVVGWIVQADGRRLRSELLRPFGLYLLAIPLASPHSEVHHLAFMLPAATIVAAQWWWGGRQAQRGLTIAGATASVLYLAATVSPKLNGVLFCAALIALGVALMKVTPEVRLPPSASLAEAFGKGGKPDATRELRPDAPESKDGAFDENNDAAESGW